jgi:hypothetical protein
MNFGQTFERLFFRPNAETIGYHLAAVAIVSILMISVLAFGLYMLISNWPDYRDVLVLKRRAQRDQVESSLKRGPAEWPSDEEFE